MVRVAVVGHWWGFAEDAVRLAAALWPGHRDINVTISYKAVYPE